MWATAGHEPDPQGSRYAEREEQGNKGVPRREPLGGVTEVCPRRRWRRLWEGANPGHGTESASQQCYSEQRIRSGTHLYATSTPRALSDELGFCAQVTCTSLQRKSPLLPSTSELSLPAPCSLPCPHPTPPTPSAALPTWLISVSWRSPAGSFQQANPSAFFSCQLKYHLWHFRKLCLVSLAESIILSNWTQM